MGPLLLHFYVTYRCNARCLFCDIPENCDIPSSSELTLDKAALIVKQAKELGIRFADFTGGEPLLYHHLPMLLRISRGLGLYTSVTTNCIRYPDMAEKLMGQITYLHFSLDSMDREEHDRIRGVKCYDKVMESISIAKSLGERPDLMFTVNESNLPSLGEMTRFAQQQKLILVINPEFDYVNNNGFSDEYWEYLSSYAYKPYVYLNYGFRKLHRAGGNRITKPRCRVVRSTIVISPGGELILPCYHRQVETIPIEPNLKTIYQSETVKQYRHRQGRFLFCEGCRINCYFDPSFCYDWDAYTVLSMAAKAKYVFDKYMRPRR
ncbi:MAG: radical SAM protein [candidate division Zixibacteria bacterium CG_4_9_14_3_um_filter_46_8]|nr:MAG: radical SAM protein [candidate division Zixibacteria bacterium CG_4_9_14_3_um_filter_46_8]